MIALATKRVGVGALANQRGKEVATASTSPMLLGNLNNGRRTNLYAKVTKRQWCNEQQPHYRNADS
jgi:hypothetical protein